MICLDTVVRLSLFLFYFMYYVGRVYSTHIYKQTLSRPELVLANTSYSKAHMC